MKADGLREELGYRYALEFIKTNSYTDHDDKTVQGKPEGQKSGQNEERIRLKRCTDFFLRIVDI